MKWVKSKQATLKYPIIRQQIWNDRNGLKTWSKLHQNQTAKNTKQSNPDDQQFTSLWQENYDSLKMSFPSEQVQNHPFFSNRSGVKSFLFQLEEEKLRAVQWHIRPTRINNVSRPCAGVEPQIIGKEYLLQINGFSIWDAIVKRFWAAIVIVDPGGLGI